MVQLNLNLIFTRVRHEISGQISHATRKFHVSKSFKYTSTHCHSRVARQIYWVTHELHVRSEQICWATRLLYASAEQIC